MTELQKERNLSDQLADALRRLDALYRADYDPATRPRWLLNALQAYEDSLARDKVFCAKCGRLLPPDAGSSVYVCYMGTGCDANSQQNAKADSPK